MEAAFEGFIDIPIPLLAEIELGKEYGSVRGVELEDIKDIDTAEKFKVWWDNQILEKHKDAEKYMKKKLKFTEEQIENYKKENWWSDFDFNRSSVRVDIKRWSQTTSLKNNYKT